MDLTQLYSGVGMAIVWLGICVFALTVLICAITGSAWIVVAWRSMLRARQHVFHWSTICAWAGWSTSERYMRQHLLCDAVRAAVDEYHTSLNENLSETETEITRRERDFAMERAMRRFAHALDQMRAKHMQAHLAPPHVDPLRATYIATKTYTGVEPDADQPGR